MRTEGNRFVRTCLLELSRNRNSKRSSEAFHVVERHPLCGIGNQRHLPIEQTDQYHFDGQVHRDGRRCDLFNDDFALEDFQFAFDEDELDSEEDSYEEADELEELDLDSMDDLADQDFAIPRSEYKVPLVFEITLEELMEMTDEY